MRLHVYNSSSEMSAAAAEWIATYAEQQLKERDRFSLLLSGGNTPKELYSLLATERYRDRIDWQRVHIFFGDERFVPFEDDRNNGKMAYDHLLRIVSIPPLQYHYISTKDDEQEAAEKYEQLLREYFRNSSATFDLALLGMGNDAHTLSLFPHSPAIHEENRWVVPSRAPEEPVHRITLTAPIVNLSGCVLFLVAGKSKAKALHEVLEGKLNPELYPSQLITRNHRDVHLFTDRDAMQLVTNHT
ncbi:MAG: 6-phosphogluconolactonase [Chitinophagaceae bacterium]|nr:6-phosphogluconolactonase [Chitinophagaceae bacterium]